MISTPLVSVTTAVTSPFIQYIIYHPIFSDVSLYTLRRYIDKTYTLSTDDSTIPLRSPLVAISGDEHRAEMALYYVQDI